MPFIYPIDIGAHGVSLDAANTPHRELGDKHKKSEPCLHLDDCFLSDEIGTETLTVLVGKLEHPKSKRDEQSSTFTCPVN